MRSISVLLCLWPSLVMAESPLETGRFRWTVSEPILEVDQAQFPRSENPWVAVKDPSVVRFGDRWHLFCTVRRKQEGDGRIHIGYMSFADWSDAKSSTWSILKLTMGYHGAPQIFFFEPHQKWYLIYQAEDSKRGLKYGPCFSTNAEISDPAGWTLPEPMYVVPKGANAGLDFWVICDDANAYLFFTTLNGKMWRAETTLENFPNRGWSKPVIALKDDIFEASHTYKLAGQSKYFTLVEAKNGRTSRYFKSYVAESLDGHWTPLANTKAKPFVSPINVVNQATSWATSYSHGELLRSGIDQRLEVDPTKIRILFQGANDQEYRANQYGNIPWQLGVLTLVGD